MEEKIIFELAKNAESIKRLDTVFSDMSIRQRELSQQQQNLDLKFDRVIDTITNFNIEIRNICRSIEASSDTKISNAISSISDKVDKKIKDCRDSQDEGNSRRYVEVPKPLSVLKTSMIIILAMSIPMVAGCAVAAGIDLSHVISHIKEIISHLMTTIL